MFMKMKMTMKMTIKKKMINNMLQSMNKMSTMNTVDEMSIIICDLKKEYAYLYKYKHYIILCPTEDLNLRLKQLKGEYPSSKVLKIFKNLTNSSTVFESVLTNLIKSIYDVEIRNYCKDYLIELKDGVPIEEILKYIELY